MKGGVHHGRRKLKRGKVLLGRNDCVGSGGGQHRETNGRRC